MRLKVITPDTSLFKDEIQSINIAEHIGGFSILKGHAPFITVVKNFVSTIKLENGNLTFIAANSGTLKVLDDEISLIIDYGVIGTNREEAQEKLIELRQEIAKTSDETGDDTVANLEVELMRRMKELGDLS